MQYVMQLADNPEQQKRDRVIKGPEKRSPDSGPEFPPAHEVWFDFKETYLCIKR
jgi:hypothetical protein